MHKKRLLSIVLYLLLVGGLLVLLSAWQFGSNLRTEGYVHRSPDQGLHPRAGTVYEMKSWMGMYGNPGQELGLAFEDVEFPAVDNSTMRGWFIPSKTPSTMAVVAVHGGESDRRSFLRHVPMLHRAGYPVLLFDYREHGISDGDSRGIVFGWRANYDVSSAVSFMKQEKEFKRVAVLGTSMGAVSAILAAARDKNIDVVIAENPYASAVDVLGDAPLFDKLPRWYRQLMVYFTRHKFDVMDEPDAIDVVADIAPRPLLLMHGTEDKAVAYWQSEQLFEQAGQPKDLWILEGAGHTTLYNKSPDIFKQKVIGFLDTYLREPANH